MNTMEDIAAKMKLPPVTQVGIVVNDLDRAMDYYSGTFGLGPYTVLVLEPTRSWYMGEETKIRLRIARAFWGKMDFELVQPLEGKTIHQDFLDAHGEGLHHLGIDVNNFDGVVEGLDRAGFKPIQALEVFLNGQWGKAAYFDTHKVGGVIMEILYRPWLGLGS